MQKSFRPGQPWYDTDGNLMQVHGGAVLFHEGTYYWCGENKEKTEPNGAIWHYGVRLYSSQDLYNWKSEGIILDVAEDSKNPLHPCRIMDRPHILYNQKNKQFVMWVKLVGTDEAPQDWSIQYMGVAVSDDITKPFKMVHVFRPLDMETGDFDVYVDFRDQKGYFIADRVHTELVIADLTDDYLNVTGNYSSHLPEDGPPLAREAPAFFVRNNRYYILASGTTGYHPNPSTAAMARMPHGPYTDLREICVNDEKQNSFDCQFSSVFKHPHKDLYIAVGDRWMAKTVELDGAVVADTREAGYIWLPICFEGEKPYIEWKEEWCLDEFENEKGGHPYSLT